MDDKMITELSRINAENQKRELQTKFDAMSKEEREQQANIIFSNTNCKIFLQVSKS
jgi:hypothetical protein